MASVSAVRSSVGAMTTCALSEKLTMPTRMLFLASRWRSTKVLAASFAASIRFGLTSSASMLPDTSIARMTVPSSPGTFTSAAGRASARTRTVKPRRKSAGGTCRRMPGPGPIACLTSKRLA